MVKTIIQAWFQFIFPPRCILCQGQMEEHAGLCTDCADLAGTSEDKPLLDLNVAGLDVLVLGRFNDSVRDLIHKLKYQGRTAVGQLWGRALGEKLQGRINNQNENWRWIVIPVPLFGARKRERGYNQCDVIALELGRVLDVKVETQFLKRVQNTPSQTTLNREERLSNVSGAFALSRKASLSGLNVILVDDVITTGATIGACAQTLRLGGVEHILALAVSRPELDAL